MGLGRNLRLLLIYSHDQNILAPLHAYFKNMIYSTVLRKMGAYTESNFNSFVSLYVQKQHGQNIETRALSEQVRHNSVVKHGQSQILFQIL